MGVEENKQAVSTLFELFQEKPFPTDKVKTYFGPEVTSRRIETGTFHGSNDEFVGYFGHMMTNMFPNAKFTTRRIVGDGDQVWIWALGEEIGPTRESVDIFTFNKDGLITEHLDVQQPGQHQL